MIKSVKDFFTAKTELKVYLSLLLFVTLILFFISNDSYTHNLWENYDSSVFFACGKAWMNGMTPYVDFADSKGPLLWLITGVAYLISPYSYVGVFWLSCLSLSVTFFLCYKIGTLLTGSRRLGYVVSVLMAFPYFIIWYEMKAEVWCHALIAASLYCLLREILKPSAHSNHTAGTIFGFAFMAALLIKWSIAVMLLSFVICCLALLLHRRVSCSRYCLGFVVAATALLLPFLVYMIATNCFHAFLYEYFLNTGKTVSEGGILGFLYSYMQDIIRAFTKKQGMFRPGIFSVAYLAGVFLFYFYRRKVTLLPFVCCAIFLAISTKHNLWTHYTITVQTFAIFLVALVVAVCSKKGYLRRNIGDRSIVAFYVSTLFVVTLMRGYADFRNGDFFFQGEERKAYYDASWLMGQLENPTIMYFGSTGMGIGMPVNALPACTYWTNQAGATDKMNEQRWKSLEKAEPDFISVVANLKGGERERVLAAGYQYYLTVEGRNIYGRKGLKMPPDDFRVSDIDILLKRKIKFDYEN